MKDNFLHYKLIGYVIYPMQPWFYSPFKDEKVGLPKYKAHWIYNLIKRRQWKELLEC